MAINQTRCPSCGTTSAASASFCRKCGTRLSQDPADGEAPTQTLNEPPAEPANGDAADAPPAQPGQRSQQPPHGGAERQPPPQQHRPPPPPPGYDHLRGAHPGPSAYAPPPAQHQLTGYPQTQLGHDGAPPPPPGYPGAAVYPYDPRFPVAQGAPQAGDERNSTWLIAGTALAVLALVGIGIAIYLAASSGSGSPARLLSAPVVTTAAAGTANVSQGASTAHAQSHTTHTTPTVIAPPPPRPSPLAEEHAVSSTIERHFSLITHHQFSAAYALLAPSLQSGESSWVAAHEADGIYNVSVDVNATVHSPTSATATIVRMTTLDAHGCKHWSGDWGLVKIGGQWRISESNLSATTC